MENQTPTKSANFEENRQLAEAVLSHKLNGQTITNGDHQYFPDVAVRIDTGIDSDGWYEENQIFNDTLTLTIEGNTVDMNPNAMRDAITKTLHEIPFIDELVRTGDKEDEIHEVKTALAKLKNAGADIPESIFKWAGFNTDNEKGHEVADYMVTVNANSQGVHTNVRLPDHLPDGMTTDDITNHIKKYESDIKDVLAEKIIKAKGGDKEEIRQQLDSLEFEIHDRGEHVRGDEVTTGNVSIDIMSPEQKAAKEESHTDGYEPPKADPELEKTNPLQSLDALDLSKAISKAIQKSGGKDADKVIPVILGAKDVMHKIENALKPFKKEHPELEHDIAEVLNSNVFDRNRWDNKKDDPFKKHGIRFDVTQNKPEDNLPLRNRMTVRMIVPEHESSAIINKLAAIELPQNQQPDEQQFLNIDSLEVLGAHSHNADLHKQMNLVIAPIVGQKLSPAESTEKMKPIAEKLITLVEDMFKDKSEAIAAHMDNDTIQKHMTNLLSKVDEAHQTIRNGIKMGAKQAVAAVGTTADTAAENESASEADIQPASATALAKQTPSPVMTPDWIKQLTTRTQDQPSLTLGA